MNPVIVEIKLSMPSKAQAARLIHLFQLLCDSLPPQLGDRAAEFLSQVQGHACLLGASYRERRDNE